MNEEITITLPLEDWTMIIGSLIFLERLDGHGRLKNLSDRINGRIIHEMKNDSQETKKESLKSVVVKNYGKVNNEEDSYKTPDTNDLIKNALDKDYSADCGGCSNESFNSL